MDEFNFDLFLSEISDIVGDAEKSMAYITERSAVLVERFLVSSPSCISNLLGLLTKLFALLNESCLLLTFLFRTIFLGCLFQLRDASSRMAGFLPAEVKMVAIFDYLILASCVKIYC